jgi:hypothetical protein
MSIVSLSFTELQQALANVVDPAWPPDAKARVRGLAHAVALILMIEEHPTTQPEKVVLSEHSRRQLRKALGVEE